MSQGRMHWLFTARNTTNATNETKLFCSIVLHENRVLPSVSQTCHFIDTLSFPNIRLNSAFCILNMMVLGCF